MGNALAWFLGAITSINWLEVIKAFAPVATAVIAFVALKNWYRQDKAKREAEFLDALIEAVHTYIAEMPKPIMLLELAKIGMDSHAPTWETGDQADIAIKGAILYIEKRGADDLNRLLYALETARPSAIKLKSLAAKGQVFGFVDYLKCLNAITVLVWHLDQIEGFAGFISSSTWVWAHPDVQERLKSVMAIEANDIRSSLRDNNIAVLEFATDTYRRVYG